MSFRVTALLVIIFLASLELPAQQFGGNPPSIRWRQINTDTARIIFPSGLEARAQEVAAIVHRLERTTLPTIGRRQEKINIVFQNQTTISNGYVGLAPFRSEFQLTPDQNSFELGSLPWPKMLAIHEYRHVQQYNNFRVGLSGAFYYLFGEGGQALANSVSVPNWFWEGDAVYQETLVSDQGRGRQPYFFNGFRSIWAAGKHYSWMKWRNGSLRDYVPDHYPLGYMLVAYGRQRYGEDFWKNVAHDAAAFRGLFYPMQKAVKRYTGVPFPLFREQALDHFRDSSGLKSFGVPAAQTDEYARSHRHYVAGEEFPQFIGRDSVVYVRSSYKRIPAFVLRDLRQGTESVVRTRAISLDNYFSCRNGKLVYAAYESDPRWGWRDYSVIRVLDLLTGEDRRITAGSKYFAPDISEDGNHVVVVQQQTDGASELQVLNAATGAVEKALPNPEGLVYNYPKFYTDDKILSAVRNGKGEMALALMPTGEKLGILLTPFTFQTIGMPSVKKDTVWFTASRNGQDRIYCLTGLPSARSEGTDAPSGQRARLFQVMLPHGDPAAGQYALQAGEGRYAWTNFTAVGFRLDTTANKGLRLEPLSIEEWARSLPTQEIDSLQGKAAGLLDGIRPGDYTVSKYPSAYHLINFHTWRPYITDPNYMFSLVSENVLNTLQSELFVNYNRNEGYTQVGADATYGAWFPWLDLGADYIFNRNGYIAPGKKLYWNEAQVFGGVSIPLNFARHLTYTSLRIGSDLIYRKDYITGIYKDSFRTRGFAYIDPNLSFTHQVQQAKAQIYPRFAQAISLNYNRAVTTVSADQFLASGYFYLPGVSFTHSLVAAAAFQQRDLNNRANFSNNFPFSRGYTAENFYRMYRFAANYHIPLLYPDWGIGNIVYFLRVRANIYYDYTKARDYYRDGSPYDGTFRSYGTEVYFDTRWWNQLPVSFGIRYSRLLDADPEGRGPNQWELILPLNLLSQSYNGRAPSHIDY